MSKTLKLSGLLILFGFLFLQGKTQNTDLSKKISISFENVTIRQAIQTLHDSTKISFSYNSELAEFDRRITHDFKFTAINDILDKILENSGLAYRVIGNQVTLYKKPQTGSINLNKAAGEIRGRVLDQNTGSPLPFVNVALEGTTLGAVTDASGNFQIKELNPDYYT
ncbi:MAG TPA: STN and carboxypeptidase regulatory-like domain-containing protein, partial [Bacteroidales bacterium]|nr:STN and carboxypeptidase regulatory-like domain-containing protein [Bacteroidales bacterium]